MKTLIEYYVYRSSQASGEIFYSESDCPFETHVKNMLCCLMGITIGNHIGFGIKCNDGFEIYFHFSDYRMIISSQRMNWDNPSPIPAATREFDENVERGRYWAEAFKAWGKTK